MYKTKSMNILARPRLSAFALLLAVPLASWCQGLDDLTTEGVNEGLIGSGVDDLTTRGINEGLIGSGVDDLTTKGINEGLSDLDSDDSGWNTGYDPYGTDSDDSGWNTGYDPWDND